MNKNIINKDHSLLGVHGVLASHHIEEVLEQLNKNKSSLLDFYGIFNQRILALLAETNASTQQIKLHWLGSSRKFFYYYPLYIFGLSSKQALSQFISAYFDLECYAIKFSIIAIRNMALRPLYLAKNTWLSAHARTRTLQPICCFSTISHDRYLTFILNPDFWRDFKELMHLYLSTTSCCRLRFTLVFEKPHSGQLLNYHLGWNSWLGEVASDKEKLIELAASR